VQHPLSVREPTTPTKAAGRSDVKEVMPRLVIIGVAGRARPALAAK
jgi:hypothetical protein